MVIGVQFCGSSSSFRPPAGKAVRSLKNVWQQKQREIAGVTDHPSLESIQLRRIDLIQHSKTPLTAVICSTANKVGDQCQLPATVLSQAPGRVDVLDAQGCDDAHWFFEVI